MYSTLPKSLQSSKRHETKTPVILNPPYDTNTRNLLQPCICCDGSESMQIVNTKLIPYLQIIKTKMVRDVVFTVSFVAFVAIAVTFATPTINTIA